MLTELLKQKFDIIMATGSPNLGRMIMAAAAPNLTPMLLELGGKSPTYVHKSADVTVSARRVAWGSFMNAGQTCIRPDHIFVDKYGSSLAPPPADARILFLGRLVRGRFRATRARFSAKAILSFSCVALRA